MSDGRATPYRVPRRLFAVIVVASFIGMTAADHFSHTSLWYFIGWSTGGLCAVALMRDESENHG